MADEPHWDFQDGDVRGLERELMVGYFSLPSAQKNPLVGMCISIRRIRDLG